MYYCNKNDLRSLLNGTDKKNNCNNQNDKYSMCSCTPKKKNIIQFIVFPHNKETCSESPLQPPPVLDKRVSNYTVASLRDPTLQEKHAAL